MIGPNIDDIGMDIKIKPLAPAATAKKAILCSCFVRLLLELCLPPGTETLRPAFTH